MQVILLEKIHRLGNIGDSVKVKSGYGRNYLVPQGKALPATEANLADIETKRAELEKAAKAQLKTSEARKGAIEKLAAITISARVSEENKLFGSVGVADIAKAATEAGVELYKSEVCLPEGPIKILGEYTIAILLPGDVETAIQVLVTPEE